MTRITLLVFPVLLLLVVAAPLSEICAQDSGEAEDKWTLTAPDLPSVDSAARIQSRQHIVSYPRFSINGGIAIRWQDNELLNQTFQRIESGLGVSSSKKVDDNYLTWNLGLRVHISPMFSVWWEYYYSGSPSHDYYCVSSNLFALLVTFEVIESALLFSFGSGVAFQHLEADRFYGASLENSGTLENIVVDTGRQTGWPLVVMLELRDRSSSFTPSLYVCGKYISASRYSSLEYYYYKDEHEIEIESEMSGYWLSIGIQLTY